MQEQLSTISGVMMPLALQRAHAVIASAHEHATRLGTQVTVAIVDEGGHLQALGRMDGAPPLSARIAEAKAASAALIRRDGASLRQMQDAWPAFFTQVGQLARTPIIAGAGTVLLQDDCTVLGALAVSGGLPEQDDECATTALAALAP
jgi:glc operon protein GlcG